MKRIFLSALIGVGMVALIAPHFSGKSAARTPQDYPLVCRGGGIIVPGKAPGVGNIGFTFTRGKRPAGEGLDPGVCSWVDRGMYDTEPNTLSQHIEEVVGTPENRWFDELRSSDRYWTFMVSNNGKGQLIATSARPGGGVGAVDEDTTATTGFTPVPDGVQTFQNHQYVNDCNRFDPLFPPVDKAPPGSNLVGYINHWHDGGLLGCTTQYNTAFRGGVWFDMSEIFSKPPYPKAMYAMLTFRKILAVANDDNGKPTTRACEDKLLAASEDWMKDPAAKTTVAGGEFDFSARIDSCPPAGCNIDVTNVVNGWIIHPETRNGFVIVGENENFLAKLIPKTNDACETRYGDFRLTVTYKFKKGASARQNVALASNKATASAKNYTADTAYPGLHFQPFYAIDGLRHTTSTGGNYWRDEHGLWSWLEVEFNGSKTIDEIDVVTLQVPDYEKAEDPSDTKLFTSQGARNFEVKYWTGSAWKSVGESIIGNSLVVRKITFSPITTSKIRLFVTNSSDGVARIVELEAWGY